MAVPGDSKLSTAPACYTYSPYPGAATGSSASTMKDAALWDTQKLITELIITDLIHQQIAGPCYSRTMNFSSGEAIGWLLGIPEKKDRKDLLGQYHQLLVNYENDLLSEQFLAMISAEIYSSLKRKAKDLKHEISRRAVFYMPRQETDPPERE